MDRVCQRADQTPLWAAVGDTYDATKERIKIRLAEKAGCARSTVAGAIKALEWAGVLTWQNRIVRVRERCQDLFGKEGWRWRVIRTSNAYLFRDPQAANSWLVPSKSDQRTETPDQAVSKPLQLPVIDPTSPLERALARFAAALAARQASNKGAAGKPE